MQKQKILGHKYIVHFILHFSIIVLSGFGITGAIITILLDRRIGPTYLEEIYNLRQILTSLQFIIFITAFIQALGLCAITFLLALFWSHSVSGPLLRFKKCLKAISERKSAHEPLAFRNTDQLHGLAQAFSEIILTHNGDNAKTLALLVEAQKILDECKTLQSQNKGSTNDFNSKLHELKKIYLLIKNIYKNKNIPADE